MKKPRLNTNKLLSIVFLIFCSCSSSSDDNDSIPEDSTYYGSFKSDGEEILYQKEAGNNNNVSGSFNAISSNNDDYYISAVIVKKEAFAPEKNNFTISLGDFVEFQENIIYTNASSTSDYEPDYFSFVFSDENGTVYTTYNEEAQLILNPNSVVDATVSFSIVTDNYMEGVFSGTVYNGTTAKVISAGEFKIVRN